MKTIRKLTINATAEKVWEVFALDFDNAYKWMASIPNSYGKNLGQKFEGATTSGRICELDQNENGMKASEKFLAYDDASKICTIEITFLNAPTLFPIKRNILNFSVTDVGEGKSEIDWVVNSSLSLFGLLIYPIFRVGFRILIGQILDELKVYVETDRPHKRKLKNLDKLRILQK